MTGESMEETGIVEVTGCSSDGRARKKQEGNLKEVSEVTGSSPVIPSQKAKDIVSGTEVVPAERYGKLVEDLKDILTEGILNSRLELVKAKWHIGQRIMSEFQEAGTKEVRKIIGQLAADLKTSESELYRCTEFFNKFLLEHKCKTIEDILAMLPEGKNISWFKIRTMYLPDLPMARIPYIEPTVEMEDKWGLIDWWKNRPDENFTLILSNGKLKLQVKVVKKKGTEQSPMKELFKEIGGFYIELKKWNVKDLDGSDYGRMNKSIKRLLIKAKGDKEKVKNAILHVSSLDYIEWTLETVEKKWADAQKPVKPYEKYLKKDKRK